MPAYALRAEKWRPVVETRRTQGGEGIGRREILERTLVIEIEERHLETQMDFASSYLAMDTSSQCTVIMRQPTFKSWNVDWRILGLFWVLYLELSILRLKEKMATALSVGSSRHYLASRDSMPLAVRLDFAWLQTNRRRKNRNKNSSWRSRVVKY